MRVIQGIATDRRPSPLEEACAHFRLDRQGIPVSPRTLGFYDDKILAWLRKEHGEVRRFEDLDVTSIGSLWMTRNRSEERIGDGCRPRLRSTQRPAER